MQGAAECGLVLVGPSHVYANDKRRRLADSAAPHTVDDAANFGAKAGGRGHKEVAHDLCGRVCVSVGEYVCIYGGKCVCACACVQLHAPPRLQRATRVPTRLIHRHERIPQLAAYNAAHIHRQQRDGRRHGLRRTASCYALKQSTS